MIKPESAGREPRVSVSELFRFLKTQSEETGSSSQFFGKYRVQEIIHSNRNSGVILAFDPDLHRQVVLKVYRPDLSPEKKDFILNEGRSLAQIDSPNVARCLSVEELGNCPCLVLEYISGSSLEKLSLPLEPVACVEIVRQVAEGLNAVHERGILHLDLKPSNVILTEQGKVKLIDFGLAQPMCDIKFGEISGTASFIAPEVANHEISKIDRRTDVFGVGAILYALLTGFPPFDSTDDPNPDVFGTAKKCQIREPHEINPDAPENIVKICMRCLAKNPNDRYPSMDALLEEWKPAPTTSSRKYPVWMAGLILLAATTTFAFWPKPPVHQFLEATDVLVRVFDEGHKSLNLRNDFDIDVKCTSLATGDMQTVDLMSISKDEIIHLKLTPEKACHLALFSCEYEDGSLDAPVISVIESPDNLTMQELNQGETTTFKINLGVLTPRDATEYFVVAAMSKAWDEDSVAQAASKRLSQNDPGTHRGAQGVTYLQAIEILPYRVVTTPSALENQVP